MPGRGGDGVQRALMALTSALDYAATGPGSRRDAFETPRPCTPGDGIRFVPLSPLSAGRCPLTIGALAPGVRGLARRGCYAQEPRGIAVAARCATSGRYRPP